MKRTPLLRSEELNRATGSDIVLKAENLQETGSFKLRGASNRVVALSETEKSAGVVAFSSGNHAQGVARAARRASVSAKIVMPSDAPRTKRDGALADGAEIIEYDRLNESREDIAAEIASREGRVLIPSFDDPFVIAGQGTAGLEIFENATDPIDHLVCCVGGGGLIAGIALAASGLSPHTRIWGAEPEGFDDHARSLQAGHRVANPKKSRSICDALLSPAPGEMTFEINRKLLAGVLVVCDEEIREAMRLAFRHLKLVVEPGGAAALAAVLQRKCPEWSGMRLAVVLTGGNVDAEVFAEVLRG